MDNDPQTMLDRTNALTDRLDQALGLVNNLADWPFDDLVGRSLADATLAEALADRLDATNADLRQNIAAVQQRLVSAAKRRRAQLRFTREGVEATLDSLATKRPASARQRWLAELAAALAASERDAVRLLLARPTGVDDSKRAALVALHDEVQADVDVVRIVHRLQDILAHDIAAHQAVRTDLAVAEARAQLRKEDYGQARRVLSDACSSSEDPAIHAEYAFLLVALSDVESAKEAAARAADLGPESALAFLAQAVVAEQVSEHSEADEMYRQAVGHLDLAHVEDPQCGNLLVASGLLHLHRARRLEEIGLVDAALTAYRDAVSVGINDPGLHADAAAYAGLARLLSDLGGDPSETWKAAYEAGRRYFRIGDNERAVSLLTIAAQAKRALPAAGFYLAAALAAKAWPPKTSVPDKELTRESESLWTQWLEQVGAPETRDAWAYTAGAYIAEQLTYVDPDRTEWTWRALLRAEKAIALDGQLARGWGLSSRYLRDLNFKSLPLEAASHAARLQPDDREAQYQLLALLSNAGRFDEAMEVLHRIPKIDSEPWLIGVRGWLRLNTGQAAECVADMTKALEGGFNPGWNLAVRVSGLVRLGRLAEAVEDLRRIVLEDKDFGTDSARRRARSFALLGEVDKADREIKSIDIASPLVDRAEYSRDKLIVEACLGRAEAAANTVAELLPIIQDRRTLDDVANEWHTALAILEFRGVYEPVFPILQGALDRLGGARPVGDAGPYDELYDAIKRNPNPDTTSTVCLVAIRARRRKAEEDYLRAANDYESLRGGPFEPEATSAFLDALTHALTAALQDGDPVAAADIHRRLATLGRSPYSSEDLVIAEASLTAGAQSKAREAFDRAVANATDAPSHFAASLRLGEAQVLDGDLDVGFASLDTALRAAESSGDAYSMARVHARLAVVLAYRGDSDGMINHLRAALEQLASTGLVNTSTALAVELREATSAMRLFSVSDVLTKAYESVTHERGGNMLKP
jgi:tetratricopeptide (TPR) repeat protein